MMKKYIAPELEISKFEAMDIVTVSGVIETKDEMLKAGTAESLQWTNNIYGE